MGESGRVSEIGEWRGDLGEIGEAADSRPDNQMTQDAAGASLAIRRAQATKRFNALKPIAAILQDEIYTTRQRHRLLA